MATITVGELSKKLNAFIKANPKRKKDGVFVYISEIDKVEEDINEITLVDTDISDRVDINIG